MIFDIVVVGASSAGLFAAEALAKQGKQVAVLDRSDGMKPEERTYIITPGLYQVMDDLPDGLIQQKIDTFRIQSGQNQTDIQLSSPDLIIDRAALLSYLAARAESAGVIFLRHCEFLGFDTLQGRTQISVSVDNSPRLITADYLIGADGVTSAVRKSLGLLPVPSVPLLQAVIGLPPGWDSRIVKVWFDVNETPYFYWLIPQGGDQAVVGLITELGVDIKTLLDGFLSQNDFRPISFQSGQAALHSRNSRAEYKLGNLPVLLVGDAAGQVKVSTVGGTVTGLAGALHAVRIIQGIHHNQSDLSLKKELDLHYLIRRLLDQMAPGDYGDLINMLNPAVTRFLSLHDRDNMRAHFWKLVVLQPRFVSLGLKLLFRSIFSPIH